MMTLRPLSSLFAALGMFVSFNAMADCGATSGTLTVHCDVTVPSISAKARSYDFTATPTNDGDGAMIEIPVKVAHPEDYDSQSLMYSIGVYNKTNNCDFPADEQIGLRLEQVQPFCNPPALPGDTDYHQTCAFPQEDPGLYGNEWKKAVDGAEFSLNAKNATLSVVCTGKFKAD